MIYILLYNLPLFSTCSSPYSPDAAPTLHSRICLMVDCPHGQHIGTSPQQILWKPNLKDNNKAYASQTQKKNGDRYNLLVNV